MKLITDYLDVMPSNYKLYLWGDLHVGNVGFKEEAVKAFNRKIKSVKHAYFGLGGDQIESITPTDKRYEMDQVDGRFATSNKQIEAIGMLFEPVADRCLWVLDGNHEWKLQNMFLDVTGKYVGELIAEELGTIYGTYTSKIHFPGFKVLDWHGWGTTNPRAGDRRQREVNRQIAVKRRLRDLAADCELMAMHHIHQMVIHPPEEHLLMLDDGKKLLSHYSKPGKIWVNEAEGTYKIPEEDRWYCSSGAALRQFSMDSSPYAERWGLPPSELGCIEVEVKKDVISAVRKVVL